MSAHVVGQASVLLVRAFARARARKNVKSEKCRGVRGLEIIIIIIVDAATTDIAAAMPRRRLSSGLGREAAAAAGKLKRTFIWEQDRWSHFGASKQRLQWKCGALFAGLSRLNAIFVSPPQQSRYTADGRDEK